MYTCSLVVELPSPKVSEPDKLGEIANEDESNKQGKDEEAMETRMEDQPKHFSKKQLARLANQWGSRRRKRLKRLASRKEKCW